MVEVLKTGLYDSIQDLGRFGVQKFGVPYSGAMDFESYRLSNTILNNAINDAVIEISMLGPKLKFYFETQICITGAHLSPKLNGKAVALNSCIQICKNDVLSFGKRLYGFRSYIAVLGGFQTEKVMYSRSMTNTVTETFRLAKGDKIPYVISSKNLTPVNETNLDFDTFECNDVEVFKGPEFKSLSKINREKLLSMDFTITSESNRMAYKFKERFPNTINPIMTSLVIPGTVQLTPSGQLIALMRDGQITGGYPRIFQISEPSLNLLSQKIFGEKIRFKCIN